MKEQYIYMTVTFNGLTEEEINKVKEWCSAQEIVATFLYEGDDYIMVCDISENEYNELKELIKRC